MSGNLARHIQHTLGETAPRGWRVAGTERRLLATELEGRVGYAPAADLVIENTTGTRRIWVELEISRADPVANHAKFAIASRLQRFDDTFVAMVSRHVTGGRRALCSHAITMMRQLGVDAFQTSLLPQLDGAEIKRLNHLSRPELVAACPSLAPDWERLLTVSAPLTERDGRRILFIGDPVEAAWNVHQWNLDVATEAGRALWAGKRGFRAVEHFVWWPPAGLFAPCKFTAFVPAGGALGMNMAMYADLDESEPLFDGRRAWTHIERIGFVRSEDPALHERFWRWQRAQGEVLRVKRDRPLIWVPPGWAT
ncbi:hypothetical protein LBMAG42_51090 [Deltaproteobacteria bacterium]|nr:hypothetical protein LBMAG42_51090 [Deltaproteobacteria bacterium]